MYGNTASFDMYVTTGIPTTTTTHKLRRCVDKQHGTKILTCDNEQLKPINTVLPQLALRLRVRERSSRVRRACQHFNDRQWMQRQSKVRDFVGGSLPARREHQRLVASTAKGPLYALSIPPQYGWNHARTHMQPVYASANDPRDMKLSGDSAKAALHACHKTA